MTNAEHYDRGESEPQLDEAQLLKSIAQNLILHGDIVKPNDPDVFPDHMTHERDGLKFVLKDIPPLRDAGVHLVEYVPAYTYEGDYNPDSVSVQIVDEEIDKTIIISLDQQTGKVSTQVDIDPRYDESASDLSERVDEDDLLKRLLSDPVREDVDVNRFLETIAFAVMADDSPSPEDMMIIEDLSRRLQSYHWPRT